MTGTLEQISALLHEAARRTTVSSGSSRGPTTTGPPGTPSGSSICPNCRMCSGPGPYAASWSICSSASTSNTQPRLPANPGKPITRARICAISGHRVADADTAASKRDGRGVVRPCRVLPGELGQGGISRLGGDLRAAVMWRLVALRKRPKAGWPAARGAAHLRTSAWPGPLAVTRPAQPAWRLPLPLLSGGIPFARPAAACWRSSQTRPAACSRRQPSRH